MEKIRMGFIGCGGNATGHIGRALEMPEVRVAALCDVNSASIARVKERYPALGEAPVFADYQKMLAQVELDAVEISTPHTLHFEQIMASLDRGLHVLTEKPMVCTSAHARAAIEKSRAAGKILMVAYQRHLAPQFRYVRNQIMAGELGKIQFISALQDQNWYLGTLGTWRQQLSLSGGGQLNDSGSHLLDILLWMTGLEVEEVQALMARGVVQQGMVPKVQACVAALRADVRKTHIIDAAIPHAMLLEIFTQQGIGTEIIHDAAAQTPAARR